MQTELVDAGFHVKIPKDLADQNPQVISQGAEALVFAIPYKSRIAKYRPAKPWRLQELDDLLRKRRTNQEARVLQRLASANIGVPELGSVDAKVGLIYMQLLKGKSLKQATWDIQPDDVPAHDNSVTVETTKLGDDDEPALKRPKTDSLSDEANPKIDSMPESVLDLYRQFGELIARMHNLNIVHGDLTTSNAMVEPEEGFKYGAVKLIDFGLSSQSASIEDKAVDLYVLERAIQSTHPLESQLLTHETLMPAYTKLSDELNAANSKKVLDRLELVRQRGRKRTQLG